MLHDFQPEWLGREIIAEWIREVEKDRLAARVPRPVINGFPLRERAGRALVRLGCSLQREPCRC